MRRWLMLLGIVGITVSILLLAVIEVERPDAGPYQVSECGTPIFPAKPQIGECNSPRGKRTLIGLGVGAVGVTLLLGGQMIGRESKEVGRPRDSSWMEELERLGDLRDRGLISEAEFEAEKEALKKRP